MLPRRLSVRRGIRGAMSLGIDYRMLAAALSSRVRPRYCEAVGCSAPTRERKPYCSEHVEQHPYVRTLLDALEQRERELEAVVERGAKALRPDSLLVADVVEHARRHGPQTVERVARQVGLPVPVVDVIAAWLGRRRLARLSHTRRGSVVLTVAA